MQLVAGVDVVFLDVAGTASFFPRVQDDLHLHGVPATTLVEAKHPAFCYWDHKERKKLGSFQEFVRHDMVSKHTERPRNSSLGHHMSSRYEENRRMGHGEVWYVR